MVTGGERSRNDGLYRGLLGRIGVADGEPVASRTAVVRATALLAGVAASIAWVAWGIGAWMGSEWLFLLVFLGIVPLALIPQVAGGAAGRATVGFALAFAVVVGAETGGLAALLARVQPVVLVAEVLVGLAVGIVVVAGLGALRQLRGGVWGGTVIASVATAAALSGLGSLVGHEWVLPFVAERGHFSELAEVPSTVTHEWNATRIGALLLVLIVWGGGLRCAVGEWKRIDGRLRQGLSRSAAVGAGAVMIAVPMTLVIGVMSITSRSGGREVPGYEHDQ